MRRHLFLLHLKRALLNGAIVAAALLGTVFVVERLVVTRMGQGAADVSETVNIILAILLLLGAFPAAAATFGRTFRDQHALFLYSLPLPRIQVWAILLGASATAYAVIVTMTLLARPSMADMVLAEATADLVAGASAALVVFAGGACLGLAAPRPAVAAAAGLVILGPTTGLLALIHADRLVPYAFEGLLGGTPAVPIGMTLFAAVLLSLSALYFLRGEHELLTQAVLRFAGVLGGVAVTALLFFGYTRLAGAPAGQMDEMNDISLSPDGRHLAIVEYAWKLRHRRLRVFDTRTGLEGFRRSSSIVATAWVSNERLLVVESSASEARRIIPIGLKTTAIFFRPDGTIENARDLPASMDASLSWRTFELREDVDASRLLFLRWYGRGNRSDRNLSHVYRIRGASLELVQTLPGSAVPTRVFDRGAQLIALIGDESARFFRSGAALEELPWSSRESGSGRREAAYLLDGIVHPTGAKAAAALEAAYPLDESLRRAAQREGSVGSYLASDLAYSVGVLNPVRYRVASGQRVSVWEWASGRWVLLTSSIEIPVAPRPSLKSQLAELPATARSTPEGFIVFARARGKDATELVAASRAGERVLGQVPIRASWVWVSPFHTGNPRLFLVSLTEGEEATQVIVDLEGAAITAVVPGASRHDRTVRVLPDGTRLVLVRRTGGGSRVQMASQIPSERASSGPEFYLVEMRPDGTRREVALQRK